MRHLQVVCILSIIAISSTGGHSAGNNEKIMKFVEECGKETNASDDDVQMFNDDAFPKTKSQYCLRACYYSKTGVINDDNTIDIDKVLEEIAYLEKENTEMYEKLVKILKDCNTQYTPVKECDSIKTYYECIVKSTKEAGLPLDK